MTSNVLWLHDLRLSDLAQVGGKNSSLGEMIGELSGLGVSVPGGFATTADAFKAFIAHNDLHARIYDKLKTVDVEDVPALTSSGCSGASITQPRISAPALVSAGTSSTSTVFSLS